MSTPCSEDLVCNNGDFIRGNYSLCAVCRFSPENTGRGMGHCWSPTSPARKAKLQHPQLVAEKRKAKLDKRLDKIQKNLQRDIAKRRVSRKAALAEKKTERNIIKATLNSGRRNKDGDHVSLGIITLDTKLQTTRENPVIFLAELEKVRADAIRAGKMIGGLVIRNKHNVGCVVMKEEDYALLTKGLSDEPKMGSTVPGTSETGVDLV